MSPFVSRSGQSVVLLFLTPVRRFFSKTHLLLFALNQSLFIGFGCDTNPMRCPLNYMHTRSFKLFHPIFCAPRRRVMVHVRCILCVRPLLMK